MRAGKLTIGPGRIDDASPSPCNFGMIVAVSGIGEVATVYNDNGIPRLRDAREAATAGDEVSNVLAQRGAAIVHAPGQHSVR